MNILPALLCAVLVAAASPQDAGAPESSFHRVHLTSGKFVDGDLVGETPAAVTLRNSRGVVTIERSEIVRVERVTMDALWKTEPQAAPSTGESSPSAAAASGDVAAAVDRLAKADADQKVEELRKVIALGPEASRHLARRMADFDDATLPFASGGIIEIKDPETVPLLLPLLKSARPGVRAEGAKILGALGDPDRADDVTPLLEDSDAIVRAEAVEAVALLGGSHAFDDIAPLCHDADREPRTRALQAVLSLAEKHDRQRDLGDVLVRAIDRVPGEAKTDAIAAIGSAGQPELWTSLTACLSDDLPQVRAAAVAALGKLGAQDAADAVLDRMGMEDDKRVRIQLAGVARVLRIQKAIDILIVWLSDEDPDIRRSAERNLGPLTGQSFGPDPEKWAAWWLETKPKQ